MSTTATTETTIATLARECAREILAQGWDADASAYDLLPGDAEALRDALDREPTREERVELERAIRDALGSAKTEAYRVGLERLPSAEEVDGDEVRYYADETRRWYRVAREDVADLGQRILRGDADAYSRWCAETDTVKVVRLSDGTTARCDDGDWTIDGELAPKTWRPATAADWVTLETMPDYLRESHRAAGNFGCFPHNGATRELVFRDDAEAIVDADVDGYARIVAPGPVPVEA